MLSITDPGNNFAFDVHQYLDNDSSGTTSQIVSSTIGRERLVQFTNWLHTHKRRGFLGEFAVANSRIGNGGTQIGDEAIHEMLDFIEANGDVWLGWTWWAAGPWWGNYMFSLEPTNLGQPSQADRPAMAVLQQHEASQTPELASDYNQDGTVDGADYVVWRDTLGQMGGALAADGDRDGDIDSGDYVVWRSDFGKSAGSSAGLLKGAGLPVPEPATLMMTMAAMTRAILCRYRRSTK
jgi:hypothetical protein